ncbi:MAG: hypothetical protein IJM54_03795 [Thermoguttaceae bacterium]|nr:hypothetical protein [Thermoguttaceae bacterium]
MTRRVLLLEPNYKNKYPPMGLMKIATYFRSCGDDVRFFKGDLKDLAARLLCEEFLEQNSEHRIKRFFPNLLRYIRLGHLNDLEDIPDFMGTKMQDDIITYHMRYVHKDYPKFDFIGVTTLFTFYWKQSVDTVNTAKSFLKKGGIFMVGGIASTILPEQFFKETGIYPHVGLLDKPGVIDKDSTVIIDELPLDYSILHEVDYEYPASNAYFGYMTRGCPRKCKFCAVKTLEPVYKKYISIKTQIQYVNERFGNRRDLLLMDNNVFASQCFDSIIDEIEECGFQKGATYVPDNLYDVALRNLKDKFNTRAYLKFVVKLYDEVGEKLSEEDAGELYAKREELELLYAETAKPESVFKFDPIFRKYYSPKKHTRGLTRYIDFNQGLDARLATESKIKKIAETNIRPLRIAFDHYDQREVYCKAIHLAAKYGIKDMSNYLLYNFEDTPDELYYRMQINVDLCQKLDVRIYSFPMKYHPIRDPDFFRNRDYIGKHWNRKFIRTIQCVLNSTKGKVGTNKAFFEQAFGRDINEFHKLLWMPERFIIFRSKYDAEFRQSLAQMYPTKYKVDMSNGSDLANEWWKAFCHLPKTKRILAESVIATNHFDEGSFDTKDSDVLKVLHYYTITDTNEVIEKTEKR